MREVQETKEGHWIVDPYEKNGVSREYEWGDSEGWIVIPHGHYTTSSLDTGHSVYALILLSCVTFGPGKLRAQYIHTDSFQSIGVLQFSYGDAALDLPGIGRISGIDALSRFYYVWLMDSFDERELILQSGGRLWDPLRGELLLTEPTPSFTARVAKGQLAFGLDGNLALKGDRVAMSISATADKDPLGKIKYLKVEGDLAQLWRHCEKVSGPVPR
ncbi:hypothetical protein CC2G_011608 [Coprinopsis cinerea AmutBmut pab1-1]|nr:hypothetical protein CC2G_011608 [Coprinopsis cinerea AmutBmut pab1-1]